MSSTRVEFINLGQAGAPLETAVARLAAYHFAAGARVLITALGQAQAGRLDEALWAFDPASFIPHGVSPAMDEADEPVLITTGEPNPNQAEVLIMARPLEPPPLGDFRLIIDFVPAGQGPELEEARARYKALQGDQRAELAYITNLP